MQVYCLSSRPFSCLEHSIIYLSPWSVSGLFRLSYLTLQDRQSLEYFVMFYLISTDCMEMDSEYLAGLDITNRVFMCTINAYSRDFKYLLQSSPFLFWNVPIYDPLHLLQLSATSNLFLCPYFYFYIFKARKRQYMDQVDSALDCKERHSVIFRNLV